jgi:RNA polymerase sigma-70 factor (ECF subfamily)
MDISQDDRTAEFAVLARIAAGDRAALKQLYFEYHPRLLRFLLRLTRNPGLAEELMNDTMVTVWRSAASFRGESRVSTWIMGIAYRRALKALAAARSRLPSMGDTGVGAESALDAGALADLVGDDAELSDWLQAGLDSLSPEHRLAIELAYFLGLSCEEIAGVCECPVGTIKTRLHYARRKLQQELLVVAGERGARSLSAGGDRHA